MPRIEQKHPQEYKHTPKKNKAVERPYLRSATFVIRNSVFHIILQHGYQIIITIPDIISIKQVHFMQEVIAAFQIVMTDNF